ncbi:MAG: ATP-grasp fold amidoligase family protein [Clostridia bacterium]|nr:ATP-grasp fold amidoligase family protein [Clostridia bacterium]
MLKDYIKNPCRVFMLLGDRGLLNWMPDEPFLRLIYRANTGKKLHLDPPVTFCEKLNWLKLYDRRDCYTQYADKLGVRDYVAETIGAEYLVPLLGVWDDPQDIDFNSLPDRFVLKATHDSGSILICRDRERFDRDATVKYFQKALRNRFYLKGRERQYEYVIPRVIAETYLDSGSDALPTDYKIYCFDGKARALYTGTDRGTDRDFKMTFYDMAWRRLPIGFQGYPMSTEDIPEPGHLDQMRHLAERLSAGIPLMRVDFYEVDGRVYFGEMTICDGSGFSPLEPPEWEERFGAWIGLPEEGLRLQKAGRRRAGRR